MVYTKIFTFGTKKLQLKSLEEISEDIETNIQFLIDTFNKELNHNLKHSVAKKFNESQINIPINLSKEFIDFLEYNADFAEHFNTFNPFGKSIANVEDIRNQYLKDLSAETIIKLNDFELDSSFLRSSYIIELLKKYLNENLIYNFTIILPYIIIASGKLKWESRFEESEGFVNKTFNLKNACALLIQDININSKGQIHEFIAVGKTLSYLKVIEKKLKALSSAEEFQEFAKTHNIDIVVLKGEEVNVFQGMK